MTSLAVALPATPPSEIALRAADIPLPSGNADPSRALFGTPSPEIGRLVCAWSDVRTDGTSLRELASAWSTGLRERFGMQRPTRNVPTGTRRLVSILWAALWGVLGGPLLGVGLVLGLGEVLNHGRSLPGPLEMPIFAIGVAGMTGLAFAISYFVLWAPRFEARCVYVGTAGVEVHDAADGRVRTTRGLYAERRPALVLSKHTYGGRVLGCRELIGVGRDVLLAGWYVREPGEDTYLVREIARLGDATTA